MIGRSKYAYILHVTKTESAKQKLMADIEGGVYAPGGKIPGRHALMAELGLARASVDKAVRELCDEGVLVSVKGGGTYVAGIASGAVKYDVNPAIFGFGIGYSLLDLIIAENIGLEIENINTKLPELFQVGGCFR